MPLQNASQEVFCQLPDLSRQLAPDGFGIAHAARRALEFGSYYIEELNF